MNNLRHYSQRSSVRHSWERRHPCLLLRSEIKRPAGVPAPPGVRRELFLIAVVIAVVVIPAFGRAMTLTASGTATAQAVNIDRVIADLEPDIQRTLVEGKIPSAAIALIA